MRKLCQTINSFVSGGDFLNKSRLLKNIFGIAVIIVALLFVTFNFIIDTEVSNGIFIGLTVILFAGFLFFNYVDSKTKHNQK